MSGSQTADVRAVWYRFRAELRSRRWAWLGLGLLVGLAVGAVLALASGARRTDSSYMRFLDAQNAYDVIVLDYDQPGFPGVGGFEKLAALPSVEATAAGELDYIPLGEAGVVALATADGRVGTEINAFKILEGRRADPDRADEVVVSFTTAEDHDLEVGSTIPLLPPGYVDTVEDPDEAAAARRFLDQAPDGRLRVVGIEASPGEFPPQLQGDKPAAHLTPAFYDLHLVDDPVTSAEALLVRLRDGADGVRAFNDEVDRRSAGPAYNHLAQADHASAVQRSVHLQAVALWILAVLVAVLAALVVGQLLSQITFADARDDPALRALGMTRRDLALVGVLRSAVIAAAGVSVGVGVAVATSPLLPIGLARTAEPDPGVHADATVLGLGVVTTVAVVVALGVWASWRVAAVGDRRSTAADRGRARPSRVARVLAAGGLPQVARVGARMALEPDRGRSAVPVRSTLAGVTLGVGALVAALTFGASFAHLLDTPRLYGVIWDLQLGDYDDPTFADRALALLLDDPRVEAVGVGTSGSAQMEVDGRRVDVIALDAVDGDMSLPVLAGRPARGPDEVVLGARTARALGVAIGDRVTVTGPGTERPMRVVGRAAIPGVGHASRLGEGALFTVAGAVALSPPELPGPADVFVRLAAGSDADAVVADVRARLGSDAAAVPASEPGDIVNFGRVESMPFVLGGILAAIAAATLAHLLLSAVRLRRRDLAILKALGFVRRQVAGTVAWQATTVVVAALVVAVPLGVALGRWTWTALADNQGVVARPHVPVLALAAVATGAILLANLIGLVPGQIAARTRPAADLRSE